MDVETHILLECTKCSRSFPVLRQENDYPEAVRMAVTCDRCDNGDFAETFYYDADGKHITRDPARAA